jgi:exopolyphosphatase/guanosine-5'-triphosphate,3'-diphosphate pyrophosphatase
MTPRFIKALLRMPQFLFVVLVLGLTACSTKAPQPNPCVERRAIFDVGSGSTKLKLADVNFCESKILRVVFEQARAVDFASDHSASPKGVLSSAVRAAGKKAIAELYSQAKVYEPKKTIAIMTGVFRKAVNANSFRSQLQNKFGFSFRIVTQELEGRYGFESVRASQNLEASALVVWDIGASTQQFISKRGDVFLMDLKDVASVGFKERVIREVHKKNPKKVKSPNPLGEERAAPALLLSRSLAKKMSADMKFKLAEPGVRVVGIGGVHRFSIAGQTGKKKSYRLRDIQRILPKQAGKTDQEIGGDYASTEVTNLILVAGFMEELGIDRVEITRADIQEGVLLSHDAWSK